MAPPRTRHSLLFALLTLAPSAWAFECKDIQAQGVRFNFEKLGGPHVVHWSQEVTENGLRWDYNATVDLCHRLEFDKGGCHSGARVCAIREEVDLSGTQNSTTIIPIDIAGTYTAYNGRNIDAQFELLRNSKSNSDAGREGVRAALHGGRFPFTKGMDQQAIIEFVCDPERDGSGKDEKDDKEHTPGERRSSRRDEGANGKCEDSDASLRFCGYEVEKQKKGKEVKTLRLEWRTKYACEDASNDDDGHWGFFTWFIIILFLATAAYLIFGSWLNYNRYGARGWDLLPHGDTIRDIPYILKDFGRKVADTVQGPGSRGGYSAV